jgi:hypothetical protein
LLLASKAEDQLRKVGDIITAVAHCMESSPTAKAIELAQVRTKAAHTTANSLLIRSIPTRAITVLQEYWNKKDQAVWMEQYVLRTIAFNIQVEQPLFYLLNYLKSIDGMHRLLANTISRRLLLDATLKFGMLLVNCGRCVLKQQRHCWRIMRGPSHVTHCTLTFGLSTQLVCIELCTNVNNNQPTNQPPTNQSTNQPTNQRQQ